MNRQSKPMCEKNFEDCKKCNHLGSPDCSRFINDFKLEDFQYCGRCGLKRCERNH